MSEHPNKLAFQEGVGYVLKSWTALKLAVEQDWGGIDSREKRDWMIEVIVDVFQKRGKSIDVEDIEDILSQIMVDEFEVVLEDDSPYHVAKHIFALYTQCIQGNLTEVERLREKFLSQNQNQFAASNCVKQESEDDVSGDEIDGEDDDDMEEPEPAVDADGWETVRRK
ncbi:Pre-rRNA-processing protein TSR2-domain-containing protein [Sporodiniella umbellata]|nr:Pre-rRNA-processing protein TSR2-domain-containing protein [Sporodiniella umbellata]